MNNSRLSFVSLSLRNYWHILSAVAKGKTPVRVLLNLSLKKFELNGEVIDLGSGSGKASYYRYLKKSKKCKLTYTDFYQSGKNIKKLDLEKKFKIKEGSYNQVLCFNTLGLIKNDKQVLNESYRILKPEGVFVLGVPFLVKLHPEPNDYFRYTHQAIEEFLVETGFVVEKIVFLGYGPFTSACQQVAEILPNPIVSLLLSVCLPADAYVIKNSTYHRNKYPLGYTFIARKATKK